MSPRLHEDMTAALEMNWEASMSYYTAAKEIELVVKQNDSWRTEGIGVFLSGKFRPGLKSHDARKETLACINAWDGR